MSLSISNFTKSCALAALIAALGSSAFAQDKSPTGGAVLNKPVATEPATGQAPATSGAANGLSFATAIQPGDKVAPGDFVRTIRPFGAWTLGCDQLLGRRRICTLETLARGEKGEVTARWQVATLNTNKVVLVIYTPADIKQDAGLRLGMDGLERTDVVGVQCSATGCVSIVPFEGPLASQVLSAANVSISYTRGGNVIRAISTMANFKDALAGVGRPDVGVPAVVMPKEAGSAVAKPANVKLKEPPKARSRPTPAAH